MRATAKSPALTIDPAAALADTGLVEDESLGIEQPDLAWSLRITLVPVAVGRFEERYRRAPRAYRVSKGLLWLR